MSGQTFKYLLLRLLRIYGQYFVIDKGKDRILNILWPKLVTDGQRIRAKSFGVEMELDLADYVQRSIYFFGAYERPIVNYLLRLLRPGMVFIDVGAHVGQYSLIAAKHVKPGGRVIAFEPDPRSIERLQINVRINGLEDIVTVVPKAVACAPGTCKLKLGERSNTGMSSLLIHPVNNMIDVLEVPVTTLDLELEGIEIVDVIKIDVEGAELLVLEGGKNIISQFMPIIILEGNDTNHRRFGYSSKDIKQWLFQLEYEIWRYRGSIYGKKLILSRATLDTQENDTILIAIPRARRECLRI